MTGAPTHVLLVVKSARALEGEERLRAAGLACALIPVPRTLTSECGVCLRVDAEHRNKAIEVLVAAGIEVPAVHEDVPSTPKERGHR